MHGFQNPYQSPANTAMDAYQKFSGCISPNGYQPYFCTGEKNKAIDQQLASYFPLESSFTFKTLNLIDKNLLNSDLWNLPLPVYQNVNKYIANYKNDIYLICHLNNAKKTPFTFPNIEKTKSALLAYYQECPGGFYGMETHPSQTIVRLSPASLDADFGYAPKHVHWIPYLSSFATKVTDCNSCHESFGIFRWIYKCAVCDVANCSDCLHFRPHPGYKTPTPLCQGCGPKLHLAFKSDWTLPLDSYIRNFKPHLSKQTGIWRASTLSSSHLLHYQDELRTMTPAYLALLDEMGYANQKQFLDWAEIFLELNRYDVAIQCTFSGNGGKLSPARWPLGKNEWIDIAAAVLREGDWIAAVKNVWSACVQTHQASKANWEDLKATLDPNWNWTERAEALLPNGSWLKLAKKFMAIAKYSEAKTCLSFIPLKSQMWQQLGDLMVASEPEMAILLYMQSNMNIGAFCEKARQFKNHRMSSLCQIAAAQMAEQSGNMKSLLKQNLDLPLFAGVVGRSNCAEWIDNLSNISVAKSFSLLLEHMYALNACAYRKIDWTKVEFPDEIDPIRSLFIHTSEKDLLSAFLKSLETEGTKCIPLFRNMLAGKNIAALCSEYLSRGDYNLALLCQKLMPKAISWEDVANSWLQSDRSGAVAALSCSSKDLSTLGNEFLTKGNIAMALCCYLQAGDLETIKFKANKGDYQTRLQYRIALYKREPTVKLLLSVLSTILQKPAQAHAATVIIKTALEWNTVQEQDFDLHKLLLKAGMGDLELLGLLESLSTRSLNTENKDWYNKTLATFQTNFKYKLIKAIQEYSLKEIIHLSELFSPLTLTLLDKTLEELKFEQMDSGPLKSMCLIAKALSQLNKKTSESCMQAMNLIMDAVLGDPSSDSMPCYALVLEKISNHKWNLQGPMMTDLNIINESAYKDNLKRTPDLKMLLAAEKSIAKLEPFDAAMSYIDLSMAINYAPPLIGSFLQAALSLAKTLDGLGEDDYRYGVTNNNHIYAHRKVIIDLALTAYTLGNSYLCPATQLYVLRSIIAILTSTFKDSRYISHDEEELLKVICKEAQELSEIAPMLMPRMVQMYDLLYVDMINRELMNTYIDQQRKVTGAKPIYQYYMLEGCWKGWIDEEKFNFHDELSNTKNALLQDKGNTLDQVENLMNWSVIPRDPEGWLLPYAAPLNLSSDAFARVKGIRFDKESGEISFIFQSTNIRMDALFDMNDVSEIMQRGISAAQFSLDPPSTDMQYHPFQEMVYAPKALVGTNYLATMLHADLLLKWLSMDSETCGLAPFSMREGYHVLERLPEDLQHKFQKLKNKLPKTADTVHRFWIEAQDLHYEQKETDKEILFTFGKCTMKVLKNRMKRNHDGTLSDEIDTDTDSPQAKFAKLMTTKYSELGSYFPELARLAELAKLQAMSAMAKSVYMSMKQAASEVKASESKILKDLDGLRNCFTFPASKNLETLVDKNLRANGVSRRDVTNWQLEDLRNKLSEQCRIDDVKLCSKLKGIMREKYNASDCYEDMLMWMSSNDTDDLVKNLKGSVESPARQKLLRLCDTMDTMGIAAKLSENFPASPCTWVPATFRKEDRHRVYGGVNMQPNLIRGGCGAAPGRGGPIYRFEHVVRCDGGGRIYGTTAAVDSVTGNTYDVRYQNTKCHSNGKAYYPTTAQDRSGNSYDPVHAFNMQNNIRDQWNRHGAQTRYYWKSHMRPNPSNEHYTNHYGKDSAHMHRSKTDATCVDRHGETGPITTHQTESTAAISKYEFIVARLFSTKKVLQDRELRMTKM